MFQDGPIRVTQAPGDHAVITIRDAGPMSLTEALELADTLSIIARIGLALDPPKLTLRARCAGLLGAPLLVLGR